MGTLCNICVIKNVNNCEKCGGACVDFDTLGFDMPVGRLWALGFVIPVGRLSNTYDIKISGSLGSI